MAYYNNFPIGYQPYYQQYQQPQPQPQNNGNLIWVQGEAGAKSYLVAPNTTAQLWDSENPVIYLKSADASGMPSIKILDYTIRGTDAPTSGNNPISSKNIEYATKADLEAFRSELEDIRKQIKGERKNGKPVISGVEQT